MYTSTYQWAEEGEVIVLLGLLVSFVQTERYTTVKPSHVANSHNTHYISDKFHVRWFV